MSANIDHLKLLVKKSSRSDAAKEEAKKHLRQVYGEKLDNNDFLAWLAKLLDLRSIAPLSAILSVHHISTVGRKMTPTYQRQEVHDFWKANSEVSVHRSNGRHYVKISEKNMRKQVADLNDNEITDYLGRRPKKKKTQQQLTTQPYHISYQKT